MSSSYVRNECIDVLLLRNNPTVLLSSGRPEESFLQKVGLNQRFWSIHRLAFRRATLSVSLQLLQISDATHDTVLTNSWVPTDFHMTARGTQRASARLWEQTLIL